MPIPIQNFSGTEPNVKECRTEYIVHDFSRCLSNNSACKYAIPAGYTSTYCLHPDHGTFRGPVAQDTHQDHMSAGHLRSSRRPAIPPVFWGGTRLTPISVGGAAKTNPHP